MPNLFLKDEVIDTSAPIVGYRILSYLKGRKLARVSIFDLADYYKDEEWFSPKALYWGLIFLYSVSLIDFAEPYVIANAST